MNLTDDRGVKIYKKEKEYSGGKFYVCTMGVASKDKNGNWHNGYIGCTFGNRIDEITNKCKIKINKAFPTVTESKGKSYVNWFVSDFEVVEQGEVENPIDPDGFVNIPDGIADEMPFL